MKGMRWELAAFRTPHKENIAGSLDTRARMRHHRKRRSLQSLHLAPGVPTRRLARQPLTFGAYLSSLSLRADNGKYEQLAGICVDALRNTKRH